MKLDILVDDFRILIPVDYIGEQVDSEEFQTRCRNLGNKLADTLDVLYMGILGDKDDN